MHLTDFVIVRQQYPAFGAAFTHIRVTLPAICLGARLDCVFQDP